MRSFRIGRTLLAVTLAVPFAAPPAGAAEITKYLPSDTHLVICLNVQQLLGAPLLKKDEKGFEEAMGKATKALEGFAINPKKDLSRIILAAGMDPQKAMLLLEGNFDVEKLTAKLKEMAKDKKNNLTYLEDEKPACFKVKLPKMPVPQAPVPDQLYFIPLDSHFVGAAFSQEALAGALAKKSGNKSDVAKDFADLVDKINPKETLSLVVVPPPEQVAGGPADGLKNVTGGITVNEGVKTDIFISTKDADSAKTLAQMINEGLNQVKTLVPIIGSQQPNFGEKQQKVAQEVLDTIKAEATDNGVKIRSNISKEFIEKHSMEKPPKEDK